MQATATAFANIGWRFFLVFIIISGLGGIGAIFLLPETKGVPLEEIAALFGDVDEVMVFSEDIHVDRNTHDLIVDVHTVQEVGTEEKAIAGETVVHRIATEADAPGKH